jgi:hypothetical protein
MDLLACMLMSGPSASGWLAGWMSAWMHGLAFFAAVAAAVVVVASPPAPVQM